MEHLNSVRPLSNPDYESHPYILIADLIQYLEDQQLLAVFYWILTMRFLLTL